MSKSDLKFRSKRNAGKGNDSENDGKNKLPMKRKKRSTEVNNASRTSPLSTDASTNYNSVDTPKNTPKDNGSKSGDIFLKQIKRNELKNLIAEHQKEADLFEEAYQHAFGGLQEQDGSLFPDFQKGFEATSTRIKDAMNQVSVELKKVEDERKKQMESKEEENKDSHNLDPKRNQLSRRLETLRQEERILNRIVERAKRQGSNRKKQTALKYKKEYQKKWMDDFVAMEKEMSARELEAGIGYTVKESPFKVGGDDNVSLDSALKKLGLNRVDEISFARIDYRIRTASIIEQMIQAGEEFESWEALKEELTSRIQLVSEMSKLNIKWVGAKQSLRNIRKGLYENGLNCWGAVLYSAYLAKELNQQSILALTKEDEKANEDDDTPARPVLVKKVHEKAVGKIDAGVGRELDKVRTDYYKKTMKKVTIPFGHVVVFGSGGAHVALSLGKGDILELDLRKEEKFEVAKYEREFERKIEGIEQKKLKAVEEKSDLKKHIDFLKKDYAWNNDDDMRYYRKQLKNYDKEIPRLETVIDEMKKQRNRERKTGQRENAGRYPNEIRVEQISNLNYLEDVDRIFWAPIPKTR